MTIKTGIFQSTQQRVNGGAEYGRVLLRVIVKFTAKACDENFHWESDMKFYYKNPLRCMMITWEALMWKIHPLMRITVELFEPLTHTHKPTSESGRQNKFQFYAIKTREQARGRMKYYTVINHCLQTFFASM